MYKLLKYPLCLLIVAMCSLVILSIIKPQQAHAATVATAVFSDGSDIPAFTRVPDGCPGPVYRREGQISWLSQAGWPTAAGPITIREGTAAVPLDLNSAVFQCHYGQPTTIYLTMYRALAGNYKFNNEPNWRPLSHFNNAATDVQIPVPTNGINNSNRYGRNYERFSVDTSGLGVGNNQVITVAVAMQQYNWFKNDNSLVCVGGNEARLTNNDPNVAWPCNITFPTFQISINVLPEDIAPDFSVENTCTGITVIGGDIDYAPPGGWGFDVSRGEGPTRSYIGTGYTTQATGNRGQFDLKSRGLSFGEVVTIAMYNYRPNGAINPALATWKTHTWRRPAGCPEDFVVRPVVTCEVRNSRVVFALEHASGTDPGSADISMRYGVNGITTTVPTERVTVPIGSRVERQFALTGLNLGDEVFAQIQVTPLNGGTSNPTSAGSTTTRCAIVNLAPSIEVNGADVWAGGDLSLDSGNWCNAVGNSGIDTNPSKTNYAALAVGPIAGFGTAGSLSSNILAFANDGSNGNYNTQGKCAKDYYQALDKSGPSPNMGGSGQYFVNSDYNLPAGVSLGAGQKITIIVDGDVTILGDVTYNYSNVTNKSRIPAFVLVASGNINIRPGVTRLDGLYVAGTNDPSASASGGTIDTCSGPAAIAPRALRADVCNQRLTVNGAFSARNIEFRRTFGNIAGTQPAEVFNVSPQFYLSKPLLESSFSQGFEVTSQEDLPPVY